MSAYRKLPGRRRGFLKGASVWLGPDQILAVPASLVLTAMKWSRPLSLVPRNRWRFVTAALISLTEICLWTLGVVYLLSGRFRELR